MKLTQIFHLQTSRKFSVSDLEIYSTFKGAAHVASCMRIEAVLVQEFFKLKLETKSNDGRNMGKETK